LDRNIAIPFMTLLLVMLSFGIIIPNLAYYAEDLNASESQVGWLMAVYSLAQFVFSPLWGRFSDAYGRRPAILVGLVGNAGGLLLFGMADSLSTLFIARGLSGMLTAAALPACMAYVADVTEGKARSRGMALMGAATGLGFILGPPVGGIVGAYGHHLPFLLAAALSGVTALFAAVFLRESLQRRARPRSWNLRGAHLLRNPLTPYFAVAFLANLTMAGLETTFPFLVQQVLGLGSSGLGWMLGIMGVAVAAFQGGLLGRLMNRYGDEMVLMGGIVANAAGFLFLASATGLTGMTLHLTVAGVGNQILRPTLAAIVSKRTQSGQGAALGTMDSMSALGRVVGPFAAGYLYEITASLPYYLGALLLSLTFVGVGLTQRAPTRRA
jgi:multidrug resistance protein